MGIRQTFSAQSYLTYAPYGGDPESLGALSGGYRRAGALWGEDGVYHFFAYLTSNVDLFRVWRVDSATGLIVPWVDSELGNGQGKWILNNVPPFDPTNAQFSWDPSGALFRWGANDVDPRIVRFDGGYFDGGVDQLGQDSFSGGQPFNGYIRLWAYNGNVTQASFSGITGTVEDFAVDSNSDRVWWRTTGLGIGEVRMHKISDQSLVATLYAPNTTKGIIPTGDGYVWIVDDYDWLTCYDYNGRLWGSVRNPLPSGSYGRVYGWDRGTKRLIELTPTANVANASTLAVRGFLPFVQGTYFTRPIPRTPLRDNSPPADFTAHICGDGGEPVAPVPVAVTASAPLGLVAQTDPTGNNGDLIAQVQPVSTGSHNCELLGPTVETRVSVGYGGLVLPQSVIGVAWTSGFPASGSLQVEVGPGTYTTVNYTGITSSSFTGCTGGTGTILAGGRVIG